MNSHTHIDEITGKWNYASLPSNVLVGQDCFLERRASFLRYRSLRSPGLVLGSGVRVYTWTEFNVEPTGLLEVGDDSVLVGAVFMCAAHIQIGQRVVISYNVTIADSDFHPIDPAARRKDAIANSPGADKLGRPPVLSNPVRIGDDVSIGIGAIVLKGITIGNGAHIAAGAVVTHDVPAGWRVAGNPARRTDGPGTF